jgi:hypothetical protein
MQAEAVIRDVRTSVSHVIDVQGVLEHAELVGVAKAVEQHGANLTVAERDLLLGLSEQEVRDLRATVQSLGTPNFVAADNNF